jgi:hypothetical protein
MRIYVNAVIWVDKAIEYRLKIEVLQRMESSTTSGSLIDDIMKQNIPYFNHNWGSCYAVKISGNS